MLLPINLQIYINATLRGKTKKTNQMPKNIKWLNTAFNYTAQIPDNQYVTQSICDSNTEKYT